MHTDDEWVFPEPPELGVFVTADVYVHGEAVLVVSRDEDGDWAFTGSMGFDVDTDHISLLHLGWVVSTHPDVCQVADLPLGWAAARVTPGAPWTRYPDPFED